MSGNGSSHYLNFGALSQGKTEWSNKTSDTLRQFLEPKPILSFSVALGTLLYYHLKIENKEFLKEHDND